MKHSSTERGFGKVIILSENYMNFKMLEEDSESFEERHRRLSLPISLRHFIPFKLNTSVSKNSLTIREESNEDIKDKNYSNETFDSDDDDTYDDNDELEISSNSECNSDKESLISPRLMFKSTDDGFQDFACRDLSLAPNGREEIEYAKRSMHGLASLMSSFNGQRPLEGVCLCMITHINAQTASTIEMLIKLGANVRVAPCNVYSTHNAIVAALAVENIPVFGWHHQTEDDFWWCIDRALNCNNWNLNILLDDGGDATRFMMEKYPTNFTKLLGIIEESMSGVHRLFRLWKNDALTRPAINLFDSIGQGLFNNFYLNRDNIVFALKQRADIFMAGCKVIVIGYGRVGRSTALGLRSAGCRVDVAEINSVAALMATMDGFNVVQLEDILQHVDVIITATGSCNVISRAQCDKLKSGTVLMNIGHYSAEIDVKSLQSSDLVWRRVRPSVHEIIWSNGKRILLLNEGHSLNLATQHSSSFVGSINATLKIMAILELYQTDNASLKNELYRLKEIREEDCARLHLPSDVRLTIPSEEQIKFNGGSNSRTKNWLNYLRF